MNVGFVFEELATLFGLQLHYIEEEKTGQISARTDTLTTFQS